MRRDTILETTRNKQEEEDIIDGPEQIMDEPDPELDDSSDSDDEPIDISKEIIDDIEDINVFNKNYSNLLKKNKTNKTLSKYEKTKISPDPQHLAELLCFVL